MKNLIKSLICAIGVVAALGLATNAKALTLSIGDSYYLGSIIDGVPSSDANEFSWVNQLITLAPGTSAPSVNPAGETLNRSVNVFGSLPAATSYLKDDVAPFDTWVVIAGNLYLLGKYGAGTVGQQESHVWYVGGLVGESVTLPSLNDRLSHSSMLSGQATSVPEGGTTLLLLGSALSLIGIVRRKLA
jgi:hypothetical protein